MGSFANVFGLYNPHPIDPVGALNQGMSLQNAIAMRKERQVQTDRLQLENQQLQRNMDAQKAIAGAISSATSQRPDGSYGTDWDAVDRSLTDQGWGREAISMRKERRDELTAGYKAMQEQMVANQKKLQMTGQLLGAHPRVDWSLQQSDPVSFQTQVGQAQIGFKGLLAKGVELGLMNPQEAQTYAQLPYTPDLERYLDTVANGALTREQQIDKARNELNDQVRRHLETAQTERVNAELPGVQADAEHKVTTSAASTLANALSLGPAAYGQARAAIPSAAVQAKFPETPDWNNKDAARKQIVAAGLTPNEIESGEETRAYRSAELANARERIDLLRARIALDREKMDQDSGGQGSGPLRKGQGEQLVQNYEKLERSTNQVRKSIEDALASGRMFVSRTGEVRPMASVTANMSDADKAETIAAYQRDMFDRYMQLTNDASQNAADKNRIYGRMGQGVSVSTEQVNAALDADRARVKGYYDLLQQGKSHATNPVAPPPAAPKSASSSTTTLQNAVKQGPATFSGSPQQNLPAANPRSPQSPAQQFTAPKVGEIRKARGVSYRFDGHQWVAQAAQ